MTFIVNTIKFILKLAFVVFGIVTVVVVFLIGDDKDDKDIKQTKSTVEQPVKPEVAKPVIKNDNVVYFCDATSQYSKASHEFTLDKNNTIISQTTREDNLDPRTSKGPSRNWDYLGDGKFKHKLLDKIYECSTTAIDNTTDTRSQYKYASKQSLEQYVMRQVKAVSGANPVKFHTILGSNYKTFPNWAASKETLKGRVRYSLQLTITNAFGAEMLYTGVVFADGGDIEEYTLREGHVR